MSSKRDNISQEVVPDAPDEDKVVGKDKHEKEKKSSKPTTQKACNSVTVSSSSKAGKSKSSSLDMEAFMIKLKEENQKIMKDFMAETMQSCMSQLRSEWRASQTGPSTASTDPTKPSQSNKFDHVVEDREADHADESLRDRAVELEVHAGDDLSDSVVDEGELNSLRHSGEAGSVAATHVSAESEQDIQWISVLKQLPGYYDGMVESEQESPSHTSFVAQTFQGRLKPKVPRLPLDGLMKQKWDDIEKYMKTGHVSPSTTANSKKFMVLESDFEKYGKVPVLDQEYTALVSPNPKSGAHSTQSNKLDKDLKIAECELKKCDESARVILRAASHGSLMVNAMNTIMNEPDKYQTEEVVNLIHGAFRTFESIADCALRITARSVLARRNIHLSQVSFKDQNAQKDLLHLPMDGDKLFHGEFSSIMHKYATMSRDAKETSDYASSKANPRKRGFPGGSGSNAGPQHKKPAMTKGSMNKAGPQGHSQITINKEAGQERRVFKTPFPRARYTSSGKQFPKKGNFQFSKQ